MGSVCDASANALLDYQFGAGANTAAPATYYVALSLTEPLDDGSGATEPSGGDYARVALTNNATSFPAAASRSKANGVGVVFPTATATWGECRYFALFDAATAGNQIAWGELSSPVVVTANVTPEFQAGSLAFTFDEG